MNQIEQETQRPEGATLQDSSGLAERLSLLLQRDARRYPGAFS